MRTSRQTPAMRPIYLFLASALLIVASLACGFGGAAKPAASTPAQVQVMPSLTPVPPTPTVAPEEMIRVAVQAACAKQPAAWPEVGSSSVGQAGARLCPDVSTGFVLPPEWIAQTAAGLRYVIQINDGLNVSGPLCGPYTRTGEQSNFGDAEYAVVDLPAVGIAVIDTKTGLQINELTVQGPPFSCPQKIVSGTTRLTGHSVSSETVQTAMIDLLGKYLSGQSAGGGASPQAGPVPTLSDGGSVAFSRDGRLMAVGARDNSVVVWDAAAWTILYVLRGQPSEVETLAFSRDGTLLAAGSSDSTIYLWEMAGGTLLRKFRGHTDGIWSLSFSSDGNLLASGSYDMTVKLWNLVTGNLELTLGDHYMAAFSPVFSQLVTVSTNNQLDVWNGQGNALLMTLRPGHTAQVNSLAFSADGTLLASASTDQSIKVWGMMGGGAQVLEIKDIGDAISSVAFSPDGKTLASGMLEGTVQLWDVARGEIMDNLRSDIGDLYGIDGLVYSPDGKLLAISGLSEVKLLEMDDPH